MREVGAFMTLNVDDDDVEKY